MASIWSRFSDERCACVSEFMADNDKCDSCSVDMAYENIFRKSIFLHLFPPGCVLKFTSSVLLGKHCILDADKPSKASGWILFTESKPAITHPINAI